MFPWIHPFPWDDLSLRGNVYSRHSVWPIKRQEQGHGACTTKGFLQAGCHDRGLPPWNHHCLTLVYSIRRYQSTRLWSASSLIICGLTLFFRLEITRLKIRTRTPPGPKTSRSLMIKRSFIRSRSKSISWRVPTPTLSFLCTKYCNLLAVGRYTQGERRPCTNSQLCKGFHDVVGFGRLGVWLVARLAERQSTTLLVHCQFRGCNEQKK